jgi:hypothetical protein
VVELTAPSREGVVHLPVRYNDAAKNAMPHGFCRPDIGIDDRSPLIVDSVNTILKELLEPLTELQD